MNDFTTELMNALAQGIKPKELFRKEIEKAINLLMECELTEFLDYEKWDVVGYNNGNSRNGYYSRQFKSEFGLLNLRIPRDRNNDFTQNTIPAYKRSDDTLEASIIHMFKKGITLSKVSELIDQMYGHYYCKSTISNLSKILIEEINNFHNRKIKSKYVAIFCDATYINVRRTTVEKEALHIIIGIDSNGNKEVLDYELFPTESSENYKNMLIKLKTNGLENVLLFISDGLIGMKNALTDLFPKSRHQTCWTHLLRNIVNRVRASDKHEITEDAKKIYTHQIKENAIIELEKFIEKWGVKYPKLKTLFRDTSNLFEFMFFPKQIRASLYTNNLIENFNKNLKRITKPKEQFPTEESLEKIVYTYSQEYNVRFQNRSHKGFKMVKYELANMLE